MEGRSPLPIGLIDDLFDLVRNFGFASAETYMLSIAVTVPRELVLIVPAFVGERRMAICGSLRDIHPEGAMVILLTADGRENVTMAADVTADDLRAMTAHVDGLMRLNGGFGPDGRRQRVPYELSGGLFRRSVDAVFGASGGWQDQRQLVPIPRSAPPEFLDAFRSMFDRPDDLADITDHFGYTYLCHRRHLQELEETNAVMGRLCLKLGITSEEQFARTPKDLLDRTYGEILQDLSKKRPN